MRETKGCSFSIGTASMKLLLILTVMMEELDDGTPFSLLDWLSHALGMS